MLFATGSRPPSRERRSTISAKTRWCFDKSQSWLTTHLLLRQLSDFTGLVYDESHLKFWEFDHHFLFGNGGAIGAIRMAQRDTTSSTPGLSSERRPSRTTRGGSQDRPTSIDIASTLAPGRSMPPGLRGVGSDEQVAPFQARLAELDAERPPTASAAQLASKPGFWRVIAKSATSANHRSCVRSGCRTS